MPGVGCSGQWVEILRGMSKKFVWKKLKTIKYDFKGDYKWHIQVICGRAMLATLKTKLKKSPLFNASGLSNADDALIKTG